MSKTDEKIKKEILGVCFNYDTISGKSLCDEKCKECKEYDKKLNNL